MSSKYSQYITLPASTSSREFPDNTLSNYKVRLATRLNFRNKRLEVALANVIYPNMWYNINNGKLLVKVVRPKKGDVIHSVDIYPGRVTSVTQLLARIHKAASSMQQERNFSLHHEPYNNTASLIIYRDSLRVKLPPEVAYIFGFDSDRWYGKGTHQGKRGTDVSAGYRVIYVYSDIAESRPVGDVMAPLLRIVPISGERNTDFASDVNELQYVPVVNKETDLVEIALATDTGRPIPFRSGNVSVTLHVREV